MLFGGKTLFVLRPVADGTHLFIGPCYVYGMMEREAMDLLEQGIMSRETFELV
jgi:hypothetical protein